MKDGTFGRREKQMLQHRARSQTRISSLPFVAACQKQEARPMIFITPGPSLGLTLLVLDLRSMIRDGSRIATRCR